MIQLDRNALHALLVGYGNPPASFDISVVVYAETLAYAERRFTSGIAIASAAFVRALPAESVLPFTSHEATFFAQLGRTAPSPRRAKDHMIAATAIAHEATLITDDKALLALDGTKFEGAKAAFRVRTLATLGESK